MTSLSSQRSQMEDERLLWTLPPPANQQGRVPSTVSFQWKNDTIYFPEVAGDQLAVNNTPQDFLVAGSTFRYPRRGVRTRCANLGDPSSAIIHRPTSSNVSYVFTYRDTLRTLFEQFNVPFPDQLKPMINLTDMVDVDELLPSEKFDLPKVALAARFPDDGNALSIRSVTIDSGNFSQVHSSPAPSPSGGGTTNTSIGYDAAICVLLYEPWVVEVHSGGSSTGPTGGPVSTALVGPGTEPVDQNTYMQKEKRVGEILGGDAERKIEVGTQLRAA
ncbi:hypothetical protein MD484_g2175, partial [Candolleomyces efflorescens]